MIRFDKDCRAALPPSHGVYRIFDPNAPEQTIRAGRTNTAAGGLRQRVYGNHLMGRHSGNLRAQLHRDGICADLGAAKVYMKDHLAVQVLVVDDERERAFLEHFMLAILQPRYSDWEVAEAGAASKVVDSKVDVGAAAAEQRVAADEVRAVQGRRGPRS